MFVEQLLDAYRVNGAICFRILAIFTTGNMGPAFTGAMGPHFTGTMVLHLPGNMGPILPVSRVNGYPQNWISRAVPGTHMYRNMVTRVPAMTTVKDHLEFSDTVTHLGHVLHCTLDDTEDIKRSTLEMCKKANIVLATFSSCNPHIKTILFNSHCLSLCGAALWCKLTNLDSRRSALRCECTSAGVYLSSCE